ncbi:hypothetical protein [Streptomyces sp. NRRL B-24572]|uniref:hypothetical protein n=1 Tax=Streptomyces sp. NRRL B-24572 TaxID=1962156 RepID=UPI000A38F05E|nr:hypothetical protein [Streptomyces sp. NRRL B-24572]
MAEQPPAEQVSAQAERLAKMAHQAFYDAWVAFVRGKTDRRVPREVQAAAFCAPPVVSRTLLTANRAAREFKVLLPRGEEESKREYQARINTFRDQLRAARRPVESAVEDLALDEAEFLAQLDDEAFAEEWTQFVLESAGRGPRAGRDLVQGLAFRNPEVAPRTFALAERMMGNPRAFLPKVEGESRKAQEARVSQLCSRLEAELRFLRYSLDYAEARWGRLPSAPNHRLQAMRLLAENHPEEFSRLLHAVRADSHQARKEAREQRRFERRHAQPTA